MSWDLCTGRILLCEFPDAQREQSLGLVGVRLGCSIRQVKLFDPHLVVVQPLIIIARLNPLNGGTYISGGDSGDPGYQQLSNLAEHPNLGLGLQLNSGTP